MAVVVTVDLDVEHRTGNQAHDAEADYAVNAYLHRLKSTACDVRSGGLSVSLVSAGAATVQEIVQWVQANLSLVALLGLFTTFAIPRSREWLLTRLLGYAWLRITQPAREAERRAAERSERGRELREAIGALEEGLATGASSGPRARVQINQALSVLERRWPDLRDKIHDVTVATLKVAPLYVREQRDLMRPFIERLRKELGEGQ